MRRLLLFIVAVCVVLVVAAALVSRTASFRRFAASFLTGAVTRSTGCELTIGHLPILRLGLRPALVGEDVVLSVRVGAERREMVRARRIELQTRILPLVRGRIEVSRLIVTGLDVVLDTTRKLRSAEAPKVSTPATQPSLSGRMSSLLSGLEVGELLVTDSSLALCDPTSGEQTRVAIDHLRLARARSEPADLEAEAIAAINGFPISLSGTLGGPAALVSEAAPFSMDVVVKTNGATVAVKGRIGKVWSLEGVDLAVQAEVSDPTALGRALRVTLAGRGPWRVEGRVRDEGSGYAVDPLTVAVGGSGLNGSLRVGSEAGASLKLSGESIDLARLLAALGVRGGPSGRVAEFAADVQTSGGTAKDWVANVAGQVRVARGAVLVGKSTRVEVERAAVATQSGGRTAVEATGSLRGVPLTVSGTVGSVAEFALGGKPLPVDVVARSEEATVRVEGQVGGVSGTALRLSGEGIELAPLLAMLGVRSEVSGPVAEFVADVQTRGLTSRDWLVNLAGQVHVARGSVLVGGKTRIDVERANVVTEAGGLGVEAAGSAGGVPLTVAGTVGGVEELAFGGKPLPVKLVVGTDGGTAAIDGAIGRVWALRGVDVGVRAEVDDPVAFGRALGARLPGGGPWLVEGRVVDAEPGYSVEALRATLGGNTLTGSMRLVGEFGTLLQLAGREIELAPLLAALGVKFEVNGRVGEFVADVRTSGRAPRDWVTNLTGRTHVAHGDVAVGQGTRLWLEHAGLATQSGGEVGIAAVGSVGGVPLTVVGEVGTVEALAFGGKALPVTAVIGTDGAAVGIEGQIVSFWALRGADVGVRLEVTDPAALGCVLGVGLPGDVPLRVVGRFRDTGARYEVDPLVVAFAGNTVTGRVGIDRSGTRPAVAVELSALALDLSDLFGAAESEEVQADQPPSERKQGPVFSRVPMALAGLEAANGRATLSFDDVALRRHAVAGSLSVKAVLSDGTLVVEPIVLRMAGGTITGGGRLDASGEVSAKLQGSAVELGVLMTALGGTGKATGGATSLRVDLHSKGLSLHEWMANLGGAIGFVVGPGRLEGKRIDLGFGLMSKVMDLINPSQKEDKHTELRCAVVNAAVEKGVVDLAERVVIETEKFTAIGSGTVNLGREVFNLDVYARSSLSLSAGLSNFSGRVHVGGPLQKPSITVNAKGATTTALSVGTAVVTYGLSLVGEDLWTKIFTKAHCTDALAGSAPAPASTEVPKGP